MIAGQAGRLRAGALWHNGIDVVDMAERLLALGYRGCLCVLTPPLPNIAMVEAELSAHACWLSVHLIETPALIH